MYWYFLYMGNECMGQINTHIPFQKNDRVSLMHGIYEIVTIKHVVSTVVLPEVPSNSTSHLPVNMPYPASLLSNDNMKVHKSAWSEVHLVER